MKDNFSDLASRYASFRPTYPQEMIDFIVSQVAERNLAVDVGTGNGQLATALAEYFHKVIGTDISEKQLQQAIHLSNVEYRIAPAEKLPFSDSSVDFLTVAQAVHWFDFDRFYSEVNRVLKPGGIIAVLGYGLFTTNPQTDEIIRNYYENIVGPYWDPERKYLDENYQTIPFPFDELPSRNFSASYKWRFDHLIGYLSTWSAGNHYKKANGSDPLELIYERLQQTWKDNDNTVTFNFLLRLGKR